MNLNGRSAFTRISVDMRLFSVLWRQLSSSAGGLEEAAAAAAEVSGGARVPRKWPLDRFGREVRTAKARRLGITTSPHKLNLVARLVRGMPVGEAERQLMSCRKLHSTHVIDCIRTAFVNARAFGLRENRLIIQQSFVGKGRYLKKVRPWRGKGRWGIEEKKYAHLTVILEELDDERWEQRVLSQYVHMQYRSDESCRKKLKEYDIEGWTTVSHLDDAFFETRDRVEGLKAALENS